MNSRKKNIALGIGNKNDQVGTPKLLYDYLNEIHRFDFDPCPIERPIWNGLDIEWGQVNFVNPPFSEIPRWISKAVFEMKKGKKSILLLPLRTNARYWEKLIWPNLTSNPQLLERTVVFDGYKRGFPTPLCLIEFDGKKEILKTERIKIHKKGTRPKLTLRKF